MPDPQTPPPRQRAKAGLTVAIIILAIIVVTFVGYNIAHVKETKQEHATGMQAGGN